MKTRVAVIGGGISGLTIAYEILERSPRQAGKLELVVFETADRAGGNLRTTRDDGFLCEWAANGLLDDAPTLDLVRRLGLAARAVRAREAAAHRFLFHGGRLRCLPMSLPAFLCSDVLSLSGRLRCLAEPLLPRRRAGPDESVVDFAARRLGREAASVLIDAMTSGIHAGDVRRLSLAAAFPTLHGMEHQHGSLVRGMLARRRAGARRATLVSFPEGLEELTSALTGALEERVLLGIPIDRVSDLGDRGFRVHPREGGPLEFDAIVLATPSWATAGIVAGLDGTLSGALAGIDWASIAVVHLGYRKDALGHALDGFGFLVPRGEGLRMLGTLWASSIFESRAREGNALLTCMFGGAHDPAAVDLADERLLKTARDELRRTMGIEVAPHFVRVLRHAQGIPQYELGHLDRVAAIDERLRAFPGLWIAGNSLRGVSVNSCIAEAPGIADAVCAFLAGSDQAT